MVKRFVQTKPGGVRTIRKEVYPPQGPGLDYLDGHNLWWPKYDKKNQRHIRYSLDHCNDWLNAMPFVRNTRSVIQAGGSVGLWARGLADMFETVYTFEPHPDLYQCLVRNASARNIIKMQAVLGDTNNTVAMDWKSLGAHSVNSAKGQYPIMTIDSLKLNTLDLIVLDVEGYESFAITGALETIQKCRPVIMIEEIGYDVKHNMPVGFARTLLIERNYTEVYKQGSDVIFAPEERVWN